ncbi:Deoxyuridine 5'-triphosphate nucleotidohydrolase [Orchesella cincta]|uniref:Deoxyuridine 5'-triphosphate nucleotidohydrolase n=1 Tax=Orchesella cincta TaxID=48709 RepID=A0A1D2MGN4_ORCCI|nr:Deoxyuridine 5'-triphosphate nucleotidohydrolase [Orchesella cincta]
MVACVIPPGEVRMIDTNIMVIIPDGAYGRLASRSSHCLHGVFVQGGVIDSDYRGTIKVVFYNSSKEPYEFFAGDRIAQLLIEQLADTEAEELPVLAPELASTRGSGGFGSTGR